MPTGIKFGTVTAFIKGESFEITTLRRDVSCDGRRADVQYSDDFAEDAKRRDFTINALSYCPVTHKIYDYFNGIEDIKLGKVIFIGNADIRIQEDYLRILRFFRFSCRYAKTIDKDGLSACIDNKKNLSKLSRERIKSEMDLLILLPNSTKILSTMFDSGIFEEIFYKWQYDIKKHLKELKIAGSFSVKLVTTTVYATMCMHFDDISYRQLLKLKFSRLEASAIIKMLKLKDVFDQSRLELELKNIWLEDISYVQYFIFSSLISDNDAPFICALYKRLQNLDKPIFPITGQDLMELGYNGKELGNHLDSLKQEWVMSDFTLDRVALINLIKNNEK